MHCFLTKVLKNLLLFLAILTPVLSLKAQQANPLLHKIEAYSRAFPVEQIYLSLDKPYYSIGDTLRFKSFLLNATLNASTLSDKIYVELFNDSSNLVERKVIVLNNGLGFGDFTLNKKLKDGTYSLRAYSNWQQNFGNDYFFTHSIYVGNANDKTWLLNARQELNIQDAKPTLNLVVKITNLKNEAAGLRDVEVYLMNNKKRIMRADLQTNLEGIITTKIPLEDTKITSQFSFVIVDKKDKERKAILPILLQETDQLDLQFMPEGGYLVNGIYGKVAFKAINADGLGKNISGSIVNSKNEQVAEFNTLHKGMGNFYLQPQNGENYAAIFNLNNKPQKVALPAAKTQGTTLRIESLIKPDSVLIYIRTNQTKPTEESYLLLAQAAGQTVLSAPLNLNKGFSFLKIAKQDFPEGIIRFTLFSPQQQPLNQRQVLINSIKKINLAVATNKTSYNTRDSVALEITATLANQTPLSGSFSVAITDDSLVQQKQHQSNIISHFLLQANIKGNIEEPGWYFSNSEPKTLHALDNLLLTQAWAGYQWDKILNQDTIPQFKPEKNNVITGRLTLFGMAAPKVNLTLLSLGKTIFFTDTTTNKKGEFIFKNLPILDTAAYTIKIKNARGKTSAATFFVNEFIPAKNIDNVNNISPWYVSADSTQLAYYKNAVKQNKQEETKTAPTGNMLQEVIITSDKKEREFVQEVAWDARFFKGISEAELKETPQKTLIELLKERAPEFTVGTRWTDGCGGRNSNHNFTQFLIGSSLISHVIVDKVNTNLAASGMTDSYNEKGISLTATDPSVFFTNELIFKTLKASDIKNITIYKGCNYYFLDITTRSARGPFWAYTVNGVYVYRPLPIYVAKDFYSPKYTVTNNPIQPDLRSTIYWDANIVTDENGKVKITFYTADNPGTYTVKIEGTDLNGKFGFITTTLKIAKK